MEFFFVFEVGTGEMAKTDITLIARGVPLSNAAEHRDSLAPSNSNCQLLPP